VIRHKSDVGWANVDVDPFLDVDVSEAARRRRPTVDLELRSRSRSAAQERNVDGGLNVVRRRQRQRCPVNGHVDDDVVIDEDL
jgi:hypothetical protein